jgi:hypothetical protein
MTTDLQPPDQSPELTALLDDPNLLPTEREALTRLLTATVAHEQGQQVMDQTTTRLNNSGP